MSYNNNNQSQGITRLSDRTYQPPSAPVSPHQPSSEDNDPRHNAEVMSGKLILLYQNVACRTSIGINSVNGTNFVAHMLYVV